MSKAGIRWACAVALLAALAAGSPAGAQELSEKSVATLMDYAWSLVPAQFSQPDGKVIITDKKKKQDSVVPIEVAKEVIHVARISAHAQVCNLIDEQTLNHRTLMRGEVDKKKWSDQQILYINQLHLTTVMLLTGKIKVVDKDGSKEVSIEEGKPQTTQTCSDEERQKVKELIQAYAKTGAAPSGAAPVAAAASAAPEKK